MHLVIIDERPNDRAALLGRAKEAIRQIGVKRIEAIEIDVADIEAFDWKIAIGCLFGVGCQGRVEDWVHRVRSSYREGLIGVTLDRQRYLSESVELRKRLDVTVLTDGDLAQLASFALDCEKRSEQKGAFSKNRGVVGVAHLKGGVGATTITASLASCWARAGLHTAILDLDDVNPHISAWGRIANSHKRAISEFLRGGEVPSHRLNEVLSPVEGFDEKLFIVGQPESYGEAFHLKANVIEESPSSASYISSLIPALQSEFDAIVIDMGRSWGVSTFASLPHCSTVIFVTDDDPMSVQRSLDGILRLKKESDDPEEFQLGKWSLLLNACTGHLMKMEEFKQEVQDLDLFPVTTKIFSVRYSKKGRSWEKPGMTLFDLAENPVKQDITQLAASAIPFFDEESLSRNDRSLSRVTNFSSMMFRKRGK